MTRILNTLDALISHPKLWVRLTARATLILGFFGGGYVAIFCAVYATIGRYL